MTPVVPLAASSAFAGLEAGHWSASLPATVWWVGGDESFSQAATASLESLGCQVTCFCDGMGAIERWPAQAPEALVFDATLAGVNGFDTCRAVRSIAALRDVPVLALLAQDDEASMAAAFEAGANDFLLKGFGAEQVAGRLRSLLRSSRERLELRRSNALMRQSQSLARMGSFEWWWRKDMPLGANLQWSAEALNLLAVPAGCKLSCRVFLRMLSSAERYAFLRTLRRLMPQDAPIALDLPLHLGRRQRRVFRVECSPMFDHTGASQGYSGVIQDVTERFSAEDRLRRLANKDPLTELPNRRQLQWRIERAIEQARRLGHHVGLVLIDLDRFRKVNDNLGHSAGDEMLMEVGMRLRGCVSHVDQIFDNVLAGDEVRFPRALEAVGRLGGDEFVALLPEIHSAEDALRVAQRIRNALVEPVRIGGQDLFASASIGIAIFPQDGATMAELMRNADVAMDAAKAKGPNACQRYSPALSARGVERLLLEAELHKAIERNELVLHYQPKIDARSRQLVGVEALMRWQRADGLVAPVDFIPIAEETGLIVALTEWGLYEAARQVSRWAEEFGFDRTVAVNLPSRMFTRHDLPDLVLSAAREAGISHRQLLLEITETGLMKDLQIILPMLHHLSHLGVQISVDDFGTGYSSLHYLTELPISELKIDRSFVVNMAKQPKAIDVIHLIISLARTMNLRVVAEGVEEINQLARLRNMDCDVVQGFLFARPMPGEALADWVRTQMAPVARAG